MKEITRKKFIGGMAATVALGWRGTFAAPARRRRNYDDMTWWDPYVEDITDVDTYLRRKFRQDVTDKSTVSSASSTHRAPTASSRISTDTSSTARRWNC